MSALKAEMAAQYPNQNFRVRIGDANPSLSNKQKWNASILSGILFLIISAPFLYKIVDQVLAPLLGAQKIADEHGHPTPLGMIVHAVVFVLIVRLLMK